MNQDNEIQGRLQRFLSRLLKRKEDVEDISQEAFLKVLEAGSKGEIQYPKAYLYRTAKNLALNQLNKKSSLLEGSIEDLAEPDVLIESTTLESDIVSQERFEYLCRAAARLPDQCREVFIMRKVYGFSQNEVAEALGLSVSTVEKHLAKAMLRCSEYMGQYGHGYTAQRSRRVK